MERSNGIMRLLVAATVAAILLLAMVIVAVIVRLLCRVNPRGIARNVRWLRHPICRRAGLTAESIRGQPGRSMVSSRNFSLSGRLPSLRADITERLEHFGAFERAAGGTAQRVVSQPHELPVKDRILAQTAD